MGSYILSERTLIALLALGAFMVLVSGFVISIFNPTELAPLLHLGAVAATALIFFAAGYVLRSRMDLVRTGEVLLAIGGGFVPLAVWTLGGEALLNWPAATIWLVASLVGLSLYIVSYLLLRDRAFASLSSIAGGSVVLSTFYMAQIPLEWGLCAVTVLAAGYLVAARRLSPEWDTLSLSLFLSSQIATPAIMTGLMVIAFFPDAWDILYGHEATLSPYAVGTAWWLGAAFYFVGYREYAERAYLYVSAWVVPFAYLFTLTETPWSAAWYNLCLAFLAGGYLTINREFRAREPLGTWRSAMTRPSLQVGFTLTLIAAAWPFAKLESATLTLYFVALVYAIAAYRLQARPLHFLAAYLLPIAYTLMLVKLDRIDAPGFAVAWFGFWLAALAAVYFSFGYVVFTRSTTPDVQVESRKLLNQPVYQVALVLTAIAVIWPSAEYAGRTLTYLLLASTFALATVLVKQRALAYIGVILLLASYGWAMLWAAFADDLRAFAWGVGTIALLISAEVMVRRTREAGRGVIETLFGQGEWKSRFASPLFLASYASSLFVIVLALSIIGASEFQDGGVPVLTTLTISGLVAVVITFVLSAATRRSSAFLYPATALFLLPAATTALRIFQTAEATWTLSRFGLVLIVLALGYLVVALVMDSVGGHYAKPIYLAGYGLSVISIGYAAFDRATVVGVLGVSVMVYAASAWLVHRGRHPSFQWTVDRLFPDETSMAHKTSQTLFLYLAAWLFPVWITLAMSLVDDLAGTARYGTALALLAPLYVLLGTRFKEIRSQYAMPWYLGGFALSALGPILALDGPTLRIVALGATIALYTGTAYVTRKPTWALLIALLLPVWLWQGLDRLSDAAQYYGVSLVVLSIGYGLLTLVLHHGSVRAAMNVIQFPLSRLALPFLVVGYILNAIGLGAIPDEDQLQFLFGTVLSAVLYAGSIGFLRKSLFAYPFVFMFVLAYNTGLDLSPVSERYVGIGLVPGILALLVAGAVLRESQWSNKLTAPRIVGEFGIERVYVPFFLAAYAGTIIVAIMSTPDWTVAALAWWSAALVYALSIYIFRSPRWLYPTYIAGLVAFASSLRAILPEFTAAEITATLVIPTWIALWAAHAIVRSTPPDAPRRWPKLGSSCAFENPWSRPLLLSGAATVVVSLIGSISDAGAGFMAALAVAVLLGALATVWDGRVEAWLTVGLFTLALQQSLRLLDVDVIDQPPVWAGAAFALGLSTLILRLQGGPDTRMWFGVLSHGSVVLGGAATIFSTGASVYEMSRESLDPLSLTVFLVGLVLITHAFVQQTRFSVYAGVASLLSAYALRLVILEVDEPQAFAFPAGVYLLGLAFNEWRRGTRETVRHVLEASGLVLVLGTTTLQSLGMLEVGDARYAYALILLILALGVFGLSTVLHWRNMFFAGIAGMIVSIAVFLEEPVRTMNTWYLVLVIGIVMLIVVGFIERRRQEIPFWLDDWRQRLDSWS